MIVKTIFILAFLASCALAAQNLSQNVIATSGEHFQNGSSSLSWTIGEPLINTLETGSAKLTQGFHQPLITVSSITESDENMAFKIYPNPTNSVLIIDIQGTTFVNADLYDILGRKLKTFNVYTSHYELDLTELAAANYFLKLFNPEKNTTSTYKIQKIR